MASIAKLRDIVDALVASARESGELQKVTQDIENFFKLMDADRTLRQVLLNSVYRSDERMQIISDISPVYGFSDITKNFLSLTLELDRFSELLSTKHQMLDRLKRAAGRIQADVTTPSELSQQEYERIKEAIANKTGREVELRTKVDPSILGGMIAKIDNNLFDSSIRTRLERMKSVLLPS